MPLHMYICASICMHMHAHAYVFTICRRTCVYISANVCVCLHAFFRIYSYEAYVFICMHIPSPPSAHPHRGGGHPENLTPPLGGEGSVGPDAYIYRTPPPCVRPTLSFCVSVFVGTLCFAVSLCHSVVLSL